MTFKQVFSQFNIFSQCRKYGVPLWQCPQFLFLVMGLINAGSSVLTYSIGNRYIEDPQIVALLVILVAAILFVIGTIVSQNFEKLAESNRLKSEFVGIVSHQLRSPLSNLKWGIDFLMTERGQSDIEKQLEYFRILKENCGRMVTLVSDLLTVTGLEQGKLPLRKEKISLGSLTEKVIADAKIFAEASNTEIELKPEENLPEIFIDPAQIKLAIGNLLDNAIRYIKSKGKIEIKLAKRNSDLYFEIKDNGVGIPEDDRKYIFQKFFRSANAKRHQTEGSGLGLYIVKSIIEKSGGKIGFSSQEGEGSTFWFTLPIK